MLRWSSNYHIPIDRFRDKIHCTKNSANGKFLLFTTENSIYKTAKRMDIERFNPVTGRYKTFKCKFDGEPPSKIINLSSERYNMCMWTSYGEENGEDYTITMFKLDLANFTWQRVTNIGIPHSQDGPARIVFYPIIGNEMSLIIHRTNKTELITVDFSTRKLSKCELKNFNIEGRTMVRKDRMFWVEHGEEYRTIYRIKKGKLYTVARDDYRIDGKCPQVSEEDFAGSILYKSGRREDIQWYFEKFDFKTMKWNRKDVEVCWYDRRFNKLKSAFEVDGKIYAIYVDRDEGLCEFRALELNPKLTTLSLHTMIDILMARTKDMTEKLKTLLSADLRSKLTEMFDWRVDEMERLDEVLWRWKDSRDRRKRVEKQQKKRSDEAKERNMLRWSSSIPIPIHEGYTGRTYRTTIGKNIWFSTSDFNKPEADQTDMMVLNTETGKMITLKCTYDGQMPSQVWSMLSKDRTIYTWRESEENAYDITLYKLNTRTLVWTKSVTIKIPYARNIPNYVSNYNIIGDKMYLILEGSVVELITIDLSTEKINRCTLKKRNKFDLLISLVYEEKLYLVAHTKKHRTISVVDGGKMTEILKDEYKVYGDSTKTLEFGFGGGILYKYGVDVCEKMYFETFDINQKKWNRTHIESCWYDPAKDLHTILSGGCEVDGKIYAVYDPNPGPLVQTQHHFFRVLELNPDLSTRCLFTLVDELVTKSSSEIDEVKNLLPVHLNEKLSKMLEWRRVELKKLRKVANGHAYHFIGESFSYNDQDLSSDSSVESDTDSEYEQYYIEDNWDSEDSIS